jgi:hypothetical protein
MVFTDPPYTICRRGDLPPGRSLALGSHRLLSSAVPQCRKLAASGGSADMPAGALIRYDCAGNRPPPPKCDFCGRLAALPPFDTRDMGQ